MSNLEDKSYINKRNNFLSLNNTSLFYLAPRMYLSLQILDIHEIQNFQEQVMINETPDSVTNLRKTF